MRRHLTIIALVALLLLVGSIQAADATDDADFSNITGAGAAEGNSSTTPTADASTLKVCPSGCQYMSIQEAVYAARPSDIIEIESGTYNGDVFLTKDLTFRGIDTGSGEPKVTGKLYYNNYKFSVKGFGFKSAEDPWPYLDDAQENSTDYWIALGDDQSNSDESYADAVDSYNKALQMDPRNPYILIQKAVALGGSGRFEESLEVINESLQIDPYYEYAWGYMGETYSRMGNYNQALNAVNQAISLNPSIGYNWYQKGKALQGLGLDDEADAAFDKAEELGYEG